LNILPTFLGTGQSLWLENITREQLQNGLLVQHIKERSIMGASVCPGACARTLRSTTVYDNAIRKKLNEGFYGEQLALELVLEDVRHAADLLRPVFDRTDGVDGWVALSVFPLSTNDAVSLVTSVANIYAKVRRPNILITIPSLPDWQEAIEEIIFREIPVSLASLFSSEQFLLATKTCLRGIERRIFAGLKPVASSYASISISHFVAALSDDLSKEPFLQGGIAMARRIYKASRDLHHSQAWECAYNAGVRPLRLIWKIDTHYDCEQFGASLNKHLIAPLTVAAIPESILNATIDNLIAGTRMPTDGGDCEKILSRYLQAGTDLNSLAEKLQNDEAASLVNSWIELLDAVAYKSAGLTAC
jgi:transaldolase